MAIRRRHATELVACSSSLIVEALETGMQTSDRQNHWQTVYTTKGEREVSWFQENPAISLELLDAAGMSVDSSIVDIGGGASRLVDGPVSARSQQSHRARSI
jgi:hypothetical protein